DLIGLDKVTIKGHRIELEQAFLNLINNAFDAVFELDEKWIEISAMETRDKIEIYFKDSGWGIPKEIQNKITEPFFTTKKERGTGLGLPLVKGIIEKHHGTFCYIDKSQHTTFMLVLPKVQRG